MSKRNWWIVLNIDGRETKIAAGPRLPDGGFDMVIFQLSDGAPVKALSITGFARSDGMLDLQVGTDDADMKIVTRRDNRSPQQGANVNDEIPDPVFEEWHSTYGSKEINDVPPA